MSASWVFTPHAEPNVEPVRQRSMCYQWETGLVSADGSRLIIGLDISYGDASNPKPRHYQGELTLLYWTDHPDGGGYGAARVDGHIVSEPATTNYSDADLTAFAEQQLADLRAAFDAGDPAVVRKFTLTEEDINPA